MKKITSLLLALFLLTAVSLPAFATELNEDSDPPEANTQINTIIAPTYVISIPEKTTINFGDTQTLLGTVKATHLQIEPYYCVTVRATAGELINAANPQKKLPYSLMSGTEAFTSHSFVDTVDAVELKIAITEADWDSAMGGAYNGIITFAVSYDSMVN
ncbi:MAG: hypothetical protein RR497_00535 [Oscillospiraceae bacterium]